MAVDDKKSSITENDKNRQPLVSSVHNDGGLIEEEKEEQSNSLSVDNSVGNKASWNKPIAGQDDEEDEKFINEEKTDDQEMDQSNEELEGNEDEEEEEELQTEESSETEAQIDNTDVAIDNPMAMVEETKNWSTVFSAAMATLGLSEIFRILLRLICTFVPALAEIGKQTGSFSFYFKPISFSSKSDLLQLFAWLILVVIWTIVLVSLFLLIFTIVYCDDNKVECLIGVINEAL